MKMVVSNNGNSEDYVPFDFDPNQPGMMLQQHINPSPTHQQVASGGTGHSIVGRAIQQQHIQQSSNIHAALAGHGTGGHYAMAGGGTPAASGSGSGSIGGLCGLASGDRLVHAPSMGTLDRASAMEGFTKTDGNAWNTNPWNVVTGGGNATANAWNVTGQQQPGGSGQNVREALEGRQTEWVNVAPQYPTIELRSAATKYVPVVPTLVTRDQWIENMRERSHRIVVKIMQGHILKDQGVNGMETYVGKGNDINQYDMKLFQDLGVHRIANAADFTISDSLPEYNLFAPTSFHDVREMVKKVLDISITDRDQTNPDLQADNKSSHRILGSAMSAISNFFGARPQSPSQSQQQQQIQDFQALSFRQQEVWIAKLSLVIFAELDLDVCTQYRFYDALINAHGQLESMLEPLKPSFNTNDVACACSKWFQDAIGFYNTNMERLPGHFITLVEFFDQKKESSGGMEQEREVRLETNFEAPVEFNNERELGEVEGPEELPSAAERRKAKRDARLREEEERERQRVRGSNESNERDYERDERPPAYSNKRPKTSHSRREHRSDDTDTDDIFELEERIEELEEDCEKHEETIDKLRRQIRKIQGVLEDERQNVANANYLSKQLANDLEMTVAQSERYKEAMESSQRECAELRSQIATASGSLNTLNPTTVEKSWDLVTNKFQSLLRHGKHVVGYKAHKFFECSVHLGNSLVQNRLRAAIIAACGAVTEEEMAKSSGDRIRSFVTGFIQANEGRLAKQAYSFLLHLWFEGRTCPDSLKEQMVPHREFESVQYYISDDVFAIWKVVMEEIMEKLEGKPGCKHPQGWEVAYLEIVEKLIQLGIQFAVVSPPVWFAVPKVVEEFDFTCRKAQIGISVEDGEGDAEGGGLPFCVIPALYSSTLEGDERLLRKACGAQ
ncbi:hypothetical protein HDU76_012763 [Blyttiomyces sp. JEL0837]|nr:hypothetical protein HDU76_012763 [Blyttiomyces sp. JEL0837]